MSMDEVAETIDGIHTDTYKELWDLMQKSVEDGTAKPMGGDGSEGTAEEPIVSSGEYGTDMASGWKHLSDAARQNITEATKAL